MYRVPIRRSVVMTIIIIVASAFATSATESQQPSKVAFIVEQLAERCAELKLDDPSILSNDLVRINPAGEIELAIHAVDPIDADREAELIALGAKISSRLNAPLLNLPPVGIVEAWIPHDRVSDAAALPWVVAVTAPSYPVANIGTIISEGVPLHGADTAQNQGIDGTGVTVGASSVGAANVAASQALGELPAVTVFNTFTGGPANDEGTAMLEIISDMAPGATLMYDDGAGTAGTAHVNALNNLMANGANAIAEDLAFDAEPAFQAGLIANSREAVAAAGVSVHSSSGNRGNDHAARVRATGTGGGPDGVNFGATPPGCANTPDNVVAIAPGGDTTFDVTLGSNTRITLQWSEPRAIFPTAGQGGFTDLNLYVMDAALTQCLAQSVGVQANGVGDTIEQISINSANTAAKIVVDVQGTSTAAAVPLLDLRWRGMNGETDATTRAGSIDPDKNYVGIAWSIGAVNPAGNLVGFSSAGPVTFELTTICPGGAAGPCTGGAGGATQTFQGLDFLGANGVSVSGVGGFGSGTCPAVNPTDCAFFGTSASAPHTAACDALVRQIIGANAAPADVRARLASTAIDLGPPGEDPTNGAGRLDCFEALGPPTALCADVTVPTDPGICTAATASIDDGSFDPFDPNGTPTVSLSRDPSGPYPLGDTTVELTVTDADGLFKVCSADVTVADQEPPTIACPADVAVECDQATDPSNTGTAMATDNCDSSPVIGFLDAVTPGACPQEYTISRTWTATDASGNVGSCVQTIEVVDTTAPTLGVVLDPDVLWPPNHKFWTITATITATDNCDAVPDITLVSITSNEPDNSNGDGNTTNDARDADIGTDDREFQLRAERRGAGDGRIYTVTYAATDDCGNDTETSAEVRVPHDQSGNALAWSGIATDGTGLDPHATQWSLVIPSSAEFDATSIDTARAYVGNYTGVQTPVDVEVVDFQQNGLVDLILVYDAQQTRDLLALSNQTLGLHYQASDGTDYAIPDVMELVAPVQEPPLLQAAGEVGVRGTSSDIVADPQ